MSLFEPVTACALALACLGTPTDSAAPSAFRLTLQDTTGRLAVVSLGCDAPVTGDHPRGEAACEAIREAGGDFTQLQPRPDACILIHDPVDVTADGTWRGRPVQFSTTYANKCVADTESKGVFAF